jgi:hypothetical protein
VVKRNPGFEDTVIYSRKGAKAAKKKQKQNLFMDKTHKTFVYFAPLREKKL